MKLWKMKKSSDLTHDEIMNLVEPWMIPNLLMKINSTQLLVSLYNGGLEAEMDLFRLT
jgi:hypothetical protein